jgi:hypothetical protein
MNSIGQFKTNMTGIVFGWFPDLKIEFDMPTPIKNDRTVEFVYNEIRLITK